MSRWISAGLSWRSLSAIILIFRFFWLFNHTSEHIWYLSLHDHKHVFMLTMNKQTVVSILMNYWTSYTNYWYDCMCCLLHSCDGCIVVILICCCRRFSFCQGLFCLRKFNLLLCYAIDTMFQLLRKTKSFCQSMLKPQPTTKQKIDTQLFIASIKRADNNTVEQIESEPCLRRT